MNIIRIKISMIIKYPLFLYRMLKRLSKELLGFSLGWMDVWIDGWISEWKDKLTIENSTSTCPKRLSLYEKESVFSSVHAFNWLNETKIHNRAPSSHLIYIFHFSWPCSPIHSKIPRNMTRITLKNPFSSQCNNLISSCEHGILVSLNIMTPLLFYQMVIPPPIIYFPLSILMIRISLQVHLNTPGSRTYMSMEKSFSLWHNNWMPLLGCSYSETSNKLSFPSLF